MQDKIYIQVVSKNTYFKVFCFLTLPLLIIFLLSHLQGKNPSFHFFVLAILILNSVVLGGMKLMFPQKSILKNEGNSFYVFVNKEWRLIGIKDVIWGKHYLKIKRDHSHITIHLKEEDIAYLKANMSNIP